MELRIDLNEPRILHKVKNDRLGMFVSAEWYKLITPYTPRDTGELMGIIGVFVNGPHGKGNLLRDAKKITGFDRIGYTVKFVDSRTG